MKQGARIHVAALIFLLGVCAALIGVCWWYLRPAVSAAHVADPVQRRTLAAWSMLLLAVLLVMLVCGIILTFRIGRFFFRPSPPSRTPYVDAWSESARRMKTPPRDPDNV